MAVGKRQEERRQKAEGSSKKAQRHKVEGTEGKGNDKKL